ncbi:MAG: class I SAM-dependent methyltransferase [candidate division KSB1 bacterium]|nr:class I SAM-dependent methyltransferase [candidate division KSB1 bacterium]MDZ7364622.1 class I SAM-dependent methyltransferase [candidate division KSB1 bacterium]MDZ7402630.1 class I SAM-dependent methyltransferase [candidate division KSB1 bacterium]
MANTMAGYKDDLAYIHDIGFGDFAKQAAPGLLEILRHHGITKGLVVDLGCGSGIWAHELVKAGYEVLGVDISTAMLELARKKAPQAQFVKQSFLKMRLPPCEAVTAIGECFNYLFDKNNEKKALFRFFSRVYEALIPGGVFIFDVVEPGLQPSWRHARGKDWAIFVKVAEDSSKHILTRRITIFRRIDKLCRRDEEIHRCRLYEGRELAGALRRLGFKVRLLRSYGAFRLYKNRVGFVARKA